MAIAHPLEPGDRLGSFEIAIDEMFEMHTFMLPAVFHAARGEIRLLLDARAALFARCFRLRPGWQEAFIYAPTAPALKDAGLVAQLRADVAMLHDLDVPPGPWRAIIRRTVPALLCLAEEPWDRAAELAREAQEVARGQAGGSVLYLARALAAEPRRTSAWADTARPTIGCATSSPWSTTRLDPPLAVRARLERARVALAEADLERAGGLLDDVGRRLGAVDLPGERAAHRHLAGERALAAGDLAAAAAHGHAAQEAFVRLATRSPPSAPSASAGEAAIPRGSRSARPATRTSPPSATVTMTGLPASAAEPTDLPARGDDPTELDDPAREVPRGR